MSLVSRDPVLLTPGPLTTSLQTKSAMLRDWGSWDAAFNAVTAKIRQQLLDIVHGHGSHVCVPMQGSGTFSVEAAMNTLVPRDGHVLVLINGAYGKRMAKLVSMMGRKVSTFETPEHVPTTPADVDRLLSADPGITHVGLIHCETSTGILNPLEEISQVVKKHGKSLVIDAMSSFGALEIDARKVEFDAVIAASGKCIEGPPGMGFVIARKSVLEQCEGNSLSLSLDLYDQWTYMEKTTQWRFTPPTHIVLAFHEALNQSIAEGGQKARLSRYTKNYEALMAGMRELGLKQFLDPRIQAPIIVTIHAPESAHYSFKDFYNRVRDKGFILYPGKLTQAETFRVGCIGAIGVAEIRQAVNAMRDALVEMGIYEAVAA
ncbi:2-aminoethylphosphonate--pyruvate transaminase [Noviherbaspirillum denitrificans]|uniref:2-aminoethylphosphonate--pyruvate transaminase n=1 Tax=Noviherbaspirillum denitrificans TaxID=1968433 RepID=A0A254TEL6_9BURK|nr:2-aminoethylphosphonate--pyruvate transaminase [Noviherbaspirillum denitrificans]OWW21044.1 2-aminoethylphosphonate--pyruvate aminotransferase [Noviherbaspirillum denitrificans]